MSKGGGTGSGKVSGSFQTKAAQIAKSQGISKEAAAAILASSSRHASKAAHKANPNLSKVKGK